MGNRIKIGKDNYTKGARAERAFKFFALQHPGTQLVLKIEDDTSQKPADFVWIIGGTPRLVEVKSTKKYGSNIKNHQLVGMLKIQSKQGIPCFYAFIDVDDPYSEPELVRVQDVVESIKRGEKEWSSK